MACFMTACFLPHKGNTIVLCVYLSFFKGAARRVSLAMFIIAVFCGKKIGKKYKHHTQGKEGWLNPDVWMDTCCLSKAKLQKQ